MFCGFTNGTMSVFDLSKILKHYGLDNSKTTDPILKIQSHDFGINAIHVFKSNKENVEILCVTGGDDQKINLHKFVWKDDLSVSSSFKLLGHNAAVKGVFTDGSIVITCGSDQR